MKYADKNNHTHIWLQTVITEVNGKSRMQWDHIEEDNPVCDDRRLRKAIHFLRSNWKAVRFRERNLGLPEAPEKEQKYRPPKDSS